MLLSRVHTYTTKLCITIRSSRIRCQPKDGLTSHSIPNLNSNFALAFSCFIHLHPSLLLQVTLPVQIQPRLGHSAVVFGYKPGFRVVVLFGGNRGCNLSQTTLLLLGESINICSYAPLFLHTLLECSNSDMIIGSTSSIDWFTFGYGILNPTDCLQANLLAKSHKLV